MKRSMFTFVLLAACSSIPIPPNVHEVKPATFPAPGIYTGGVKMWSLSYRIGADGTGRSCNRRSDGHMAYGDVRFDGTNIVTQDGTLALRSVGPDRITVAMVTGSEVTLTKVATAPTDCREALSQ